jgi:NAD(P)-dependent dehydrogenase (short-subunit alcohol dehydrogenase family)
MTKNIIIIGSSGAIGSSFLKHYAEEDKNNIIYALSRSEAASSSSNIHNVSIDIESDSSISNASSICSEAGPFDIIIVTTGMLSDENISPEKSLRHLNKESLSKIFSVNTLGPALIAKYFIPLLKKDAPSFLGFLSARVGSISDNRIGGWYSYRASKAALNMIIKSLSIEVARNNPQSIIAGLHPGTVDSKLSKPFQGNVSEGKLFTPDYSVSKMAEVISNLKPENSGSCFAWDGDEIEY